MSAVSVPTKSVRIGLIQGREQGSPEADLNYAIDRIREAAAGGANVICTQERSTRLTFA